eukprot:763143-Hanusia_phi.AAC.4
MHLRELSFRPKFNFPYFTFSNTCAPVREVGSSEQRHLNVGTRLTGCIAVHEPQARIANDVLLHLHRLRLFPAAAHWPHIQSRQTLGRKIPGSALDVCALPEGADSKGRRHCNSN